MELVCIAKIKSQLGNNFTVHSPVSSFLLYMLENDKKRYHIPGKYESRDETNRFLSAKTKALIRCAGTAELISVFDFHYSDSVIPPLPLPKISRF